MKKAFKTQVEKIFPGNGVNAKVSLRFIWALYLLTAFSPMHAAYFVDNFSNGIAVDSDSYANFWTKAIDVSGPGEGSISEIYNDNLYDNDMLKLAIGSNSNTNQNVAMYSPLDSNFNFFTTAGLRFKFRRIEMKGTAVAANKLARFDIVSESGESFDSSNDGVRVQIKGNGEVKLLFKKNNGAPVTKVTYTDTTTPDFIRLQLDKKDSTTINYQLYLYYSTLGKIIKRNGTYLLTKANWGNNGDSSVRISARRQGNDSGTFEVRMTDMYAHDATDKFTGHLWDQITMRPPGVPAGDEFFAKGLLNVTHPPYNAVANDGNDDTAALQRAIIDAYEYDLACYIPIGTFQISKQLRVMQKATLIDIANSDGSGGQRVLTCPRKKTMVIIGEKVDASGNRPVIKATSLPAGKSAMYFWAQNFKQGTGASNTAGTDNPAHSQSNIGFNIVIKGLTLDVSGRTGAYGLGGHGAQGTSVHDMKIIATGAKAGIYNMCGVGGGYFNIEVEGGTHGLYVPGSGSNTSEYPLVTGLKLFNQTGSAINVKGLGGLAIVGLHLKKNSGPAIIMQNASNLGPGSISIIDGIIELNNVNQSEAIRNNTQSAGSNKYKARSLYLQNVFIKNANKVTRSTNAYGQGWSRVNRYGFTGFNDGSFTESHAIVQGTSYGKGTAVGVDVDTNIPAGDVPNDLITRHIWDEQSFPSFEDSDVVNVKDLGAVGNGISDDFSIIQNAINGNEKIFLPKGMYMLTQPLTLRAHTKIFGLGISLSMLRPTNAGTISNPNWANNAPVIKTDNDVNGDFSTTLAFVCINFNANSRNGAIEWRAGGKSMVRAFYVGASEKFYGLKNVPNMQCIKITAGGGGRWWAACPSESETTVMSKNAAYRLYLFEGTTEPTSFYGYNVERNHADPQTEIRNAENIFLYSFKGENHTGNGTKQTILEVNNSNNIMLLGYSGIAQAPLADDQLIKITNSTNVLVANYLPQKMTGLPSNPGDTIAFYPPGGGAEQSIPYHDGCALFVHGNPQLLKHGTSSSGGGGTEGGNTPPDYAETFDGATAEGWTTADFMLNNGLLQQEAGSAWAFATTTNVGLDMSNGYSLSIDARATGTRDNAYDSPILVLKYASLSDWAYIYIKHDNSGGTRTLQFKSNTSTGSVEVHELVLASGSNLQNVNVSNWHNIKARVNGANLTVWVDGNLEFSGTENILTDSAFGASTVCGLRSSSASGGVEFDNFQFWIEPDYREDFNDGFAQNWTANDFTLGGTTIQQNVGWAFGTTTDVGLNVDDSYSLAVDGRANGIRDNAYDSPYLVLKYAGPTDWAFVYVKHDNVGGPRTLRFKSNTTTGSVEEHELVLAAGSNLQSVDVSEWHNIKARVNGANLTIWVDGNLEFTGLENILTDAVFNANTVCGVRATAATGEVEFDNFEFWDESNSNSAPVLDPIADRNVTEGNTVEIDLSANDPDGDGLTFTGSGLPGFATLTSYVGGTGKLEVAPGFNDSGTYSITIEVSDGSLSDEQSFGLTVVNFDRPPVVNPINNPNPGVNENGTLVVSVSASDPDNDYVTITVPNLPAFGSLAFPIDNEHGEITFSPSYDDSGVYNNIAVTATAGGLTHTLYINLTVNNVNRPPDPIFIGDVNMDENQSQDVIVSTSDPDGDSIFFDQSGLPGFASLFDDGHGTATITLAPDYTEAGVYSNITIFADDDNGGVASDSFSLTVSNVNRQPQINSTHLDIEIEEGCNHAFVIAASDPDLGDSLSLSVAGLPGFETLTSNGGSGTLVLEPAVGDAGTYNVTIKVDDGNSMNNTDSKSFVLTVTPLAAGASILYSNDFSSGTIAPDFTENTEDFSIGSGELASNTPNAYKLINLNSTIFASDTDDFKIVSRLRKGTTSGFKGASLRFRDIDANNFYQLEIRDDAGTDVRVFGKEGGNTVFPGQWNTGLDPTVWNTVSVSVSGSNANVYLGNNLLGSVTLNNTTGLVGVRQLGGDAWWDYYRVVEANAPDYIEDFDDTLAQDWSNTTDFSVADLDNGDYGLKQVSGSWKFSTCNSVFSVDENYSVSVDGRTVGVRAQHYESPTLTVKYKDSSNWITLYVFQYTETGLRNLHLKKRIAGNVTDTAIATNLTSLSSVVDWHTIKAQINGDSLSVWVNGVQEVVDYVESDLNVVAFDEISSAGVRSTTSDVSLEYDNFLFFDEYDDQ